MKHSYRFLFVAIVLGVVVFFLLKTPVINSPGKNHERDGLAEGIRQAAIETDSSGHSSSKGGAKAEQITSQTGQMLSSILRSPKAEGWYEEALREGLVVFDSFTPSTLPNVTYVHTDLKHPWIRIETRETKMNGRIVEHWDAAVADHLILRKRADVSEDELREVLGKVSVRIISELGLRDTYLVGLDIVRGEDVLAQAKSSLSAMDDVVDLVEADSLIARSGSPDTQPALVEGEQWALHNSGAGGGISGSDIDALSGWAETTNASGIVVAVVDTGIDYFHDDLISNIWTNPGEIPDNGIDDDGNGHIDDVYGIDAYNNDNDPADDNGHGTHCAVLSGPMDLTMKAFPVSRHKFS